MTSFFKHILVIPSFVMTLHSPSFKETKIDILIFINEDTINFILLCHVSELKIPIRISATALSDMEGDTKPTKSDAVSAEKGPCCPCPKTKEELEEEAEDRSYRKVFENFLHNSIFTPRYDTRTDSAD